MKSFHKIKYRLRNPRIRTHSVENIRLWSRGDFSLINSPCTQASACQLELGKIDSNRFAWPNRFELDCAVFYVPSNTV